MFHKKHSKIAISGANREFKAKELFEHFKREDLNGNYKEEL